MLAKHARHSGQLVHQMDVTTAYLSDTIGEEIHLCSACDFEMKTERCNCHKLKRMILTSLPIATLRYAVSTSTWWTSGPEV